MTLPPMPTEAELPASAAVGHETRDVDIGVVLWLGVSVALSMAIAGIGVWALLAYYEGQASRNDPKASPLADSAQIPPSPRLQKAPNREFRQFQAEQQVTLASYGWVDREQSIVRIPISRAMELLAERGLPTPKPPERSESPDQPESTSSPDRTGN